MENCIANPLRGKIIEKYGTIGKFADAMGWSQRKASYITGGRQQPTAEEVEKIADKLQIEEAREFMRIFYPNVSIKWTNMTA